MIYNSCFFARSSIFNFPSILKASRGLIESFERLFLPVARSVNSFIKPLLSILYLSTGVLKLAMVDSFEQEMNKNVLIIWRDKNLFILKFKLIFIMQEILGLG